MTSGWICPKCGRVYAPFIMACNECNNAPTLMCHKCGKHYHDRFLSWTEEGIVCAECRNEKAKKAEQESGAINHALAYKAPDRKSPLFSERYGYRKPTTDATFPVFCHSCYKECSSAYHMTGSRIDGDHWILCDDCWIVKERGA